MTRSKQGRGGGSSTPGLCRVPLTAALALSLLAPFARAAAPAPTAKPAVAAPAATPAESASRPAVPIIAVHDVRPGMTGYGLTVFKGTQPERFSVRVIGVLRNYLPQTDLILIESDDARLIHSGIVAGMSGSPIYLDGKLAGALAYGWAFGKDPVAGVTPIEKMLTDLHRPLRARANPPLAQARPDSFGVATPERFVAPLPRRELLRALAGDNEAASSTLASDPSLHRLSPGSLLPTPRLQRAAVPLSVAGMSERALDGLREALGPYQVSAMQTGGAGAPDLKGPDRFEPGGALGVQLIRGDISATGVGTVTYVEGDRVAAFGHPMLGEGGAGEVYFPIATATITTIMASLMTSFKMSTPVKTLGSLLLDRDSGIVGEVGKPAAMIPVHLTVQTPGQIDRVFNTEVARHRFLTPTLIASVAASAIQTAVPDISDATVRVQSRLGLRGFADLQQTDTMFSPSGVSARMLQNSSGLRQLNELLFNPFGPTRIERLDLNLAVEYRSDVAEITGLSLVSDELEPDTRPSLYVTLRPYSGVPQVRAIPFEVPRSLAGQTLKIEASAGNLVKAEVAPPESLADLVENLRKGYASRQLVVTLTSSDEGITHRGRIIPSLPASVIATLRPGSTTRRGDVQKRLARFAIDVGPILIGSKELIVQVKDDPR